MINRAGIVRRTTRRGFLAAGVAGALAGCLGGNGDDPPADGDQRGSDSVNGAETGGATDTSSEFESILKEPSVPLVDTLPEYANAAANSAADKDSIPAIDDPTIAPVDDPPGLLTDDSVVFGVEIDGEARAYPHFVLVWHEIVNDTLGGTSFSVTYCPLTGTAIGYQRGDTTFGVEGWLINSNLILFDRMTDSWWPQVLGTAVDGPLIGYSLPEVRVVWTTWGRWTDTFPETTVVTDDTEHIRNYGSDPYGEYDPHPAAGYYTSDSTIFPVMHEDDRLRQKRVVMGSRTADGIIAFDKPRLREDRILSGDVNGRAYLAAYDPRLDTAFVYRESDDDPVDLSTGAGIDVDGDGYSIDGTRYTAGGLPLDSVNVFDAMWFAWVAFYPNTELVA